MNKPFRNDKKKRSGILGFICNDFLRKLFAVIIALLVTLLVKGSLDEDKTVVIDDVPVKFELPENVRFQSSIPPEITVKVTVWGKRSVVDNLTAADCEIVKKVPERSLRDGNVKISVSDVELKKKHILFAATPEIRAVTPGSVHLELDRIIQEDITVSFNYDKKELPQGYALDQAEMPEDRRQVRVTGPSRIVSPLKKIDTERVPLDKATQDFTMDVKLIRPSDSVSLSFDSVPLTFRISGQVPKDFSGVPVQLLLDPQSGDGPSYTYTVEPAVVTVNLEEPATAVGKTEKPHLHPYVLTAGLKEGRTQCAVRFWSDKDDVRITSIVPDTVTVLVTKTAPVKPQPGTGGAKK